MGFRFLGGTGMDGLAPTDWHIWFDDFDKYTASDWTITTTEAGAGDATEAVGNLKDGVLVITNDAADNDADFFQWTKETFKWAAGKPLYVGARVKISDATQTDFVFGLQITDTTPLAVTDGIYFRKDDDDANLDCVVMKDSVSTGSLTAASTLANDTWTVLEFYYDGVSSNIVFYKDGVGIGSVDLDYVPDDEELALSFGIQNGSANARVLSIDWIKVGQLRG